MSNMTHFHILFGTTEKMPFVFLLCVTLVLRQNQDVWNFHGSLTFNNGKLIDILETLGMSLCQL